MAFRDLTVKNIEEADIIIAGIPYDLSASVGKGTAEAPKRLRELSEYLPPYTMGMDDIKPLKIVDIGDYHLEKNEKKKKKLSEEVYELLKKDKFTLFLGGDHAVAISTEKAFINKARDNHKTPVLLHLDAHADICDFYDGSSLSHATPVKRAIDNGIAKDNVVMFGIRSYEDQEVEYLNQNKEIKVFNANDLNNRLDEIIKYIKDKYSDSNKYEIHLSFDIDMVDPSYAPGTGTPEHFGVESKNALKLVEEFIKDLNITSMDLVEISPALDVNDITSWLGLKILYELFYLLKVKLGK